MQQTIEGFRLSPQQTRLWLLQQQNNAYHALCSLLIEGQLHIPTLRQALEVVFKRHEMYRTSFRRLPGVKLPVQVVNPSPFYSWRHCDISLCSPIDQQKQLEILQHWPTGIVPAFDLERGMFAQCTLVTLQEEKHALLISMHAMYSDTATLYHFVEEVSDFYKNDVSADQPDAQYLHFSEWQNALLETEGELFVKAYWQDRCKNVFTSLTLPFEQKHIEQVSFSPTCLAVTLDADIYAQVDALVEQAHWLQKQQFSLSVFLLACWQILLWRLTGQEDLLIGLSVDGRTYEELAGVAGLLVKDMPFVGYLTWDVSLGKLFAQTHKTTDELLSFYPYFSWEMLENSTATALWGKSTGSIYPFSFEFKEQPAATSRAGISFSLQQCCAYYEPFKIKLVAIRRASCLSIEMHYDANLFDRRDIQRIAYQFVTLVEDAAKRPEARISELNMLSLMERKQLLVELNQTQARTGSVGTRTGASPIPTMCMHQWFERQVASTPDAVAVYDGEKQLTYRGLDHWANRVARYLRRERGVQAEVLVGLCLSHSVELLVCILGILKAGGAYVPLDPAFPRKRLASLATDANIAVMLTTTQFLDNVSEIEHIVCLDTCWETLARHDGETPPECQVLPLNLAYVIYTSGSTGQPKGVMISHQGLVHYVNWAVERYEVAKGFGTPLHSSLAFDLTVTSLFPALVVGCAVWITEALADVLRTGPDFSLVKLTPAHLDLLNQWLAPADLTSASSDTTGATRKLVIGGEALRAESLATWRRHAPETRLINEYGPTETVVGCCIYEVPAEGVLRRNVPIGRPIANTQIYLLDRHMQPVPLGEVGEIYIGGIGVARGYLHRADLTAERFVPHPFVVDARSAQGTIPIASVQGACLDAGARLYRTGDLARYISADGELEYMGRVDEQIKVHGYRVEPGEIESMLLQHPAVRECVVVAREDTVGDQQLVAYVVGSPDPAALQTYLRELLPHYMVPTWFMLLKKLPLTVNGKVDRRSLPAPERQVEQESGASVVPHTAIEELLAQLWCDVLGRSQVSRYDSFFELGGHSLLAMRLLAQVQAVFQVELPVRVVFDQPTIAGLAQHIEWVRRSGEGIEMPPLVAIERPQKIPLSFAQQRLWFLDQLEPGSIAYLIPNAYRLWGMLNVEGFERSLSELIGRHESLRTTFPLHGDQPVQVIHLMGNYCLPVIDLQGVREDERTYVVHQLVEQETHCPCDLTSGPLLRSYLLRLSMQEHVWLLTLHHIITDGWSLRVLVLEMTTLYQAQIAGEPIKLPELPIQYADYALWQRQWLQGEFLDGQLAYWSKQLANVEPLDFPTDHPGEPIQTYRGVSQSLQLPLALSEGLITLSKKAHVTLFMLGLTAFQTLLLRYTGQTDISVGVAIANRTRAEIEGVVGFFVNTLVLRTDLSGNPPFSELLTRVREVCLEAYAHQDVPFEKLVEVLQPERDQSRSPLVQAAFQLEDAVVPSQLVPGLKLEALAANGALADFDLRVMIRRTQQGLQCTAIYDTNRFEGQTIRSLLEHFQTLLTGIVAQPEQLLGDLPLLSEVERQKMLVEWNATQTDGVNPPLQDRCVHQLFEEQVERTPDAAALVFEDQIFTYAELNRRANQLACYLQGVVLQGPEMLVGVLMPRCIEMVIALLAVLKAGGAYIPLDPAYPVERLIQIVAQRQISLGLTLSAQRALTNQEGMALRWLYLDIAGIDVWQESNHSTNSTVYADHLAYVISTSGSTGTPKGVAVSHRALVNRLLWCQQAFPLTGRDRVLQMASISFDIAFWELFGPLIAGAQVLLAPEDAAQESRGLVHWFIEQAVTIAHAVPSLLRVWLQEPAFCQTQKLRHFFCGGEAWWSGLAQRFQEQHHACLTQWYGPTEAAINVTSWTCPNPEKVADPPVGVGGGADAERGPWSTPFFNPQSVANPRVSTQFTNHVPPIGRPIANMQIYLLDKNLQPVPIGVAGEVYIGGVGLARGYFQQPELTAEKFIPNPFVPNSVGTGQAQGTVPTVPVRGERLYHTGDLAHYRIDGSLEFLGRTDHQVKLRGHRIELGEIETVLAQHSAVQEAVVIRREDEVSGTHLVAYIVPDVQRAEAANQEVLARLAEERLQYWQQLYEETYRQGPLQVDADLNLVGWNSSYTGQPFPMEEMQAWLSDTVALVEMYHPKRLLEIGCGTGLLLFRLAPLVDHYYGTDFSATALEGIRKLLALSQNKGMQAGVTLWQKQASDFSGLPQGLVDTVLINSVVQYFPDVNYLLRVLEGALRLVALGGRIIVGDVRSLPLLEAFHASVQLYRAPETLTRQRLWQRVQCHLQQEEELVIAPAFFRDWAQTTGQVSRVEVRLKRGRLHNELTQFRYQVVMHVGEPVTAESVWNTRITEEVLNWTEQSMTLERLSENLTKGQPKRLRLWQVPNERVGQAIQTLQWLKGESGPETAGQWRAELSRRSGGYPYSGVEPEDLWELAEQLGYDTTINWEHQGTDGSYSALLAQRESERCGDAEEEVVRQTMRSEPVVNWQRYANQPLWREIEGLLVPQVRKSLQEKLPDYMVPAHLVMLSALPLLPNGKIDRRALPAPKEMQHEVYGKQEQARTPMEELLLGLWCGLLGRTQLGVTENFFDVGGHSLLATQLIARVRAMLGVEVPVRVLFEAPTVAELAWRIEQTLRQSAGIEILPLVRVARPAEIPLSFAQQRLWFLDQLEPESTAYLIPEVLHLRGVLNTRALESSWQGIVHRHEILRTTFVANDSQPLQVIHPSRHYVLPLIDLQGLGEGERAVAARLLARQEALCPMRLAKGPLLRTYLLRLDVQEYMFLLTLHHIISDGWSTGVLVREIATLYQANVSGPGSSQRRQGTAPHTLAGLPIQYADYALWQRQWLQGEVLQKHIAYWQHQLEGASVLELPTDVPRAAVQSNHGTRYSFILPKELSAQLVSLSRQENVTLFMTLLSAFQALLYRLTGQTDIVVGTDVANRTYVETEGLIGFFVNLLALRTHVQRSLSFRETLHSVRRMVLGAYSHQELPFEVVIEQLGLERKEKKMPLIQVLFVLQNIPEIALSLPGIELEVMESVSTMAKFDLALFLQEESEGIRGSVVYRATLFKEQTIATWARRLKTMLSDAVTRPNTPIDELEIYTDEEKMEQANHEKELYRAGSKNWRMRKGNAMDVSELQFGQRGKE